MEVRTPTAQQRLTGRAAKVGFKLVHPSTLRTASGAVMTQASGTRPNPGSVPPGQGGEGRIQAGSPSALRHGRIRRRAPAYSPCVLHSPGARCKRGTAPPRSRPAQTGQPTAAALPTLQATRGTRPCLRAQALAKGAKDAAVSLRRFIARHRGLRPVVATLALFSAYAARLAAGCRCRRRRLHWCCRAAACTTFFLFVQGWPTVHGTPLVPAGPGH